ncbi:MULTISPECIES: hypothetical protein [Streptomyces]|uniref:Uncharacterized protein n=2 Tax=Streptomyces TaxID=1883 RepID=A0ABV9IVW2_9ACTN
MSPSAPHWQEVAEPRRRERTGKVWRAVGMRWGRRLRSACHVEMLLLGRCTTRAGAPGGEQLPGDLPGKTLGDATHLRIVRGPLSTFA